MQKGSSKKRILASFVSLIILLAFISGCGTAALSKVTIEALYSENLLVLPIRSQQDTFLSVPNIYGNYFMTRRQFPNVVSIIELSIEEMNGSIVQADTARSLQALITIEHGEKTDHFLLRSLGRNNNQTHFFISTLAANIRFEFTVGEYRQFVLMPMHFISDRRVVEDTVFFALYEGIKYELWNGIGIADFYDFFANSGWFDVEKKDGVLKIEPVGISETRLTSRRHESAYPSPFNHVALITHQLIFHFYEHIGINYFRIEKGE